MYFFGREMISIFISEANEQVLSQAQQYLHLSVPFYFFLSQIFIYRNAVQGMGIAMIPMFSGIVELILRTSAAVYLTEYFGYSGICYASPIAWRFRRYFSLRVIIISSGCWRIHINSMLV